MVTAMANLFDGLSFAFIVLILLVLYDIQVELRIIKSRLNDGEHHDKCR